MSTLQGKIALVTGASRGIGQGIAVSLAKAGADVALADISLEVLEETKKLVEIEGVKVKTYQVNVTEYETVNTLVQAVATDFGTVGLAKAFAKEGESEEQSWLRNQESLLPQGEAQTPEDMGALVVYLASAAHVTGQAIAVDGGFGL
jgi:NAD(P)-dependent dehydrogenase (short-subunit alcohol dehydrogenase family)